MITRIWHGKTDIRNGDTYLNILKTTGLKEYLNSNAVKSIKILREDRSNSCHFWLVTEWKDFDSVKIFTGENPTLAKYYRVDDKFLLEKENEVLNLKTYSIYGELSGFVELLETLFRGGNWTDVSFHDVLQGISFEVAVRRKMPNRNTIFEILHHVIQWRLFLLTRLKRRIKPDCPLHNSVDWPVQRNLTHEDWKNLKVQFNVFHREIIFHLRHSDDELLAEIVPDRQYNYRHLINGIIQHDHYHLGQIVLLN